MQLKMKGINNLFDMTPFTLLGKKGNGKVSKNVLLSQNQGFDLQGISFFKISLDQRHYLPKPECILTLMKRHCLFVKEKPETPSSREFISFPFGWKYVGRWTKMVCKM